MAEKTIRSVEDLLNVVFYFLDNNGIGEDEFLRGFNDYAANREAVSEIKKAADVAKRNEDEASATEEGAESSDAAMDLEEEVQAHQVPQVAQEPKEPARIEVSPSAEVQGAEPRQSTDSDTSNEGWKDPNSRKRKKTTKSKLPNKKTVYQEVVVDGDVLKVPVPKREEPEAKKAEDFPPPIILEKSADILKVLEVLRKNGISPRRPAKETNRGIRILTKTSDDFRKAVKILEAMKISCRHYTLKEDVVHKNVIKGVPPSVPVEVVESILKDKGIDYKKVVRLSSKGEPASMLMVYTATKEDAAKVMGLTEIADIAVTAEEKRKEDSRQCFRCQRFGHVSMNCTYDPRCVKCAGPHRSWDCTRPKLYKATCANCGADHPASAYNCPENPRKARKTKQPPAPKLKDFPPIKGKNAPRKDSPKGISYRDAAGPKNSQAPPGLPQSWKDEMVRLMGQVIPGMLKKHLR